MGRGRIEGEARAKPGYQLVILYTMKRVGWAICPVLSLSNYVMSIIDMT